MVRPRVWLLSVFLILMGVCHWAQSPPPEGPPRPARPGDSRRDVMRLYLVQRMREALALSDAQTLKAMEALETIDKQRAANQLDFRVFLEAMRQEVENPATSDARCKELVAQFQKKQAQNETALRDLEGRLLSIMTPRQQAQYLLLRRQLMEELRDEGGRALKGIVRGGRVSGRVRSTRTDEPGSHAARAMLKEILRFRGFDLGGRWGEKAAARHLEELGYAVLARNYRVRGGEADLIVAKDGLVAVVEVKSRRGRRFGTAAQAVTREKIRRVLLAGRVYCRRHGISLSRLRGDVVTVEGGGTASSFQITHWPGSLREG